MTTSELAREVFALVEAKFLSRTTPVEFELAYHARVAMDRIRFAIKHTERFAPHTDPMQEAGLQLLDALQRLETAERRFQERSRIGGEPTRGKSERGFSARRGDQIEPPSLEFGVNGRFTCATKDE